MLLCLAAGVAAGAYLLWSIFTGPHGAVILDDHIVYVTEHRHSAAAAFSYLAATSRPLFLSSRRTVVALGAIILLGIAVTSYTEAGFQPCVTPRALATAEIAEIVDQ